MRKSTIFISAVLTTFALVMLYRVASAYNDSKNATNVAAEPTSIPVSATTEEPADIVLGPEEAAQLAAQVVGKTNLLSAETSNFNGVDAYMITFTNDDVVYVGLDGQILAVQVAPEVVNVVAPPAKQKNKNNDGNQKARNPSRASRESNNGDHEKEDHDDD